MLGSTNWSKFLLIVSSLLDYNCLNEHKPTLQTIFHWKREFSAPKRLEKLFFENVSKEFYSYVKVYNEQCIESVQWNDYETLFKWTWNKYIIILQPSYVLFVFLLTLQHIHHQYQETSQLLLYDCWWWNLHLHIIYCTTDDEMVKRMHHRNKLNILIFLHK